MAGSISHQMFFLTHFNPVSQNWVCVCVCVCMHAHTLLFKESCPTLCDPMDCSTSGSSLHGASQAKILEWIAMSSSRGSSWPSGQTCISCIGSGNLNLHLLQDLMQAVTSTFLENYKKRLCGQGQKKNQTGQKMFWRGKIMSTTIIVFPDYSEMTCAKSTSF